MGINPRMMEIEMSKRARLKARRRQSERLSASYGKFGMDYLHRKYQGEYLIPTVQELGFGVIIRGLIPENFGDEELKRLWKSEERPQPHSESRSLQRARYHELLSQLRRHPNWLLSNQLGDCGAKIDPDLFSEAFFEPPKPLTDARFDF